MFGIIAEDATVIIMLQVLWAPLFRILYSWFQHPAEIYSQMPEPRFCLVISFLSQKFRSSTKFHARG
jgi:hypothetical protein